MSKLADSSNRIRVKNIYTGVSFEFNTMVNSARFLGATGNNVRYGIMDEVARVYCIDGEEYTMEFGERERKKNGRKGIHCRWRGIYDRVWWT